MRYRLVIEEHAGYVHARAVGQRTPENVLRFLQDSYAACVKSERSSLLLEMNLSGPSLGTMSIFRVISQRAPTGATLAKIAYVDPATTDPAEPRFAETVAVNRGVNVRLFPDVTSAAQWLSFP